MSHAQRSCSAASAMACSRGVFDGAVVTAPVDEVTDVPAGAKTMPLKSSGSLRIWRATTSKCAAFVSLRASSEVLKSGWPM